MDKEVASTKPATLKDMFARDQPVESEFVCTE
jgi:hypothetical protein